MKTGFEPEPLRGDTPGGLDDTTLAYIEAAEACFEDLRQAIAQMAGLLLLAASGSRSAGPHHPMVAMAAERLAAAREATFRLEPRGPRPRHHHQHLVAASDALVDVLTSLRTAPLGHDGTALPSKQLASAWEELGAASRALPGFDLVDFGQACCAQHASAGRLAL